MNKEDNEKNNNQRHRIISKRPMSFYINYCFFILGLEIREAIYPKNTAAAIPPLLALRPPVNAPINPFSLTASIVPLAKLYPNPVRGTVAPVPAKSTRYLYIPSPPKITPVVT